MKQKLTRRELHICVAGVCLLIMYVLQKSFVHARHVTDDQKSVLVQKQREWQLNTRLIDDAKRRENELSQYRALIKGRDGIFSGTRLEADVQQMADSSSLRLVELRPERSEILSRHSVSKVSLTAESPWDQIKVFLQLIAENPALAMDALHLERRAGQSMIQLRLTVKKVYFE